MTGGLQFHKHVITTCGEWLESGSFELASNILYTCALYICDAEQSV